MVKFGEVLIQDLQRHVRGQLAPYEYPKDIEFIDALPMTTTGKVQRRVLRLRDVERQQAADAARGSGTSARAPAVPGTSPA